MRRPVDTGIGCQAIAICVSRRNAVLEVVFMSRQHRRGLFFAKTMSWLRGLDLAVFRPRPRT